MVDLVWFDMARAVLLLAPAPVASLPHAASAKLFWALLVKGSLFVLIVEST